MSTVVGKTSIKIDDLINQTVIGGSIDATSGHLLLNTRGGAVLDGGPVVKPFGAAWSSASTYSAGDIVGYAGALWKATGASTNKPPVLFNSLWNRLTGETLTTWVERDPYFDGDSISEAWQLFWKTGTVTSSLDTVAGEFETGIQSLKLDMAASSFQRAYQKEENILYGGEVITLTVRARLLSAVTGVTVNAEMLQNNASGKPEPFETGVVYSASSEGAQALTTSWGTYVFTMTAQNAKPRAIVDLLVNTGANAAVVLIDRVKITRGSGKNVGPLVMFKATRQGGAAIAAGAIPFLSVSFNEGNAAWDGTVYTVPYSGYYELTSQFKNTSATPYATNIGFQKSTDGGTTWTQIAYSPNNANTAFGGTLVEMREYFSAGTKLRVNCTGTITPQSDAPAENMFFTARLLSYNGISTDGVKQSPNIVNLVGNMGTSNPVAVLSFTVQDQSKIKLTGYMTAYQSVASVMHTVTVTVNGVTTTVGHLFFNEASSHKPIPIEGVIGPLPAGTYTLTFNLTGANAFLDSNDFYNITMQEILTGGWSAPTITDSGWISVGSAGAPAFLNSWVNFDGRTLQYRKIGNRVQMRGIIKNGTIGGTIFILPVGFRPPARVSVDQYVPIVSNNAFGAIGIDATGTPGAVIAAVGSNAWMDLSGVSFLVD